MPSPQLVALAHRLIANIVADTTDLGDHVYRGDGSIFTDPERFEAEREAFFRRTPQVVGWGGEVAEPGDVLARVVAGVPVLVTRDGDGALRAFLNACTHRGMGLCDGADNTRRLTCGYHGWTYDLAGRLVGLPHREPFPGLDTDSLGLQPLPVEEQAGLVVVGLAPRRRAGRLPRAPGGRHRVDGLRALPRGRPGHPAQAGQLEADGRRQHRGVPRAHASTARRCCPSWPTTAPSTAGVPTPAWWCRSRGSRPWPTAPSPSGRTGSTR